MSLVRRLVDDQDLVQPWREDKKIQKDLPTFTLEGATPQLSLAYPGQQTIALRLPTKDRIEAFDAGANTSLGYIPRFKVGQRIPFVTLHRYAEGSYTANATIDALTVPLSTGIPESTKLRIFLKADIYNNGGATTTLKAVFSDGTAALTTTATAYVTLSTIVDVPTPNVDGEFSLSIEVSGGTAFIKNVTAMLLAEYK